MTIKDPADTPCNIRPKSMIQNLVPNPTRIDANKNKIMRLKNKFLRPNLSANLVAVMMNPTYPIAYKVTNQWTAFMLTENSLAISGKATPTPKKSIHITTQNNINEKKINTGLFFVVPNIFVFIFNLTQI
tara:strand:- start:770 stop:1159 length:390 start_codon:yes stop_codon:yes gene_type:complete